MLDLDRLPYISCSHKSAGTNRHELIVVHMNEGPERATGAEELARYLARPDITPGYHVIVDSDSAVRCAGDNEIPWGAGGVNSRALHVCIIGYSAQSPIEWDDPFDRAALTLAAEVVRQWATRYGIPVDARRPDAAQYDGRKGLVAHADVSRYHAESEGHTDPGAGFPWSTFVAMVNPSGPSPEDLARFFALMEALDVEHGQAVDAVFEPNPNAQAHPRGYVLERWGSVTPVNGAKPIVWNNAKHEAPYWPGKDVARQLVVTDWETPSGYLLDLNGGLHPFGACAPPIGAPYWKTGKLVDFAET